VNEQEFQWSDLMRAGNRGDTTAYHRLLAALAPALRGFTQRTFVRARLPGGDVEDVVQETLLALHLKRHTWDETQPLVPWLKAIARNKVIDSLRRKGGHVHVDIDDFSDTLADERVQDAARTVEISGAVARLKGREREIVVAISLEGASARDVAQRLGISEGAVRVALHRALKTLAMAFGSKEA
jgi:RNA polymerase sigma-70 factor, ECF subfamily